MKQRTKNELRCFCSREPLLAVYGLDEKNKIYIHIKIYKNRRIFGEVFVYGPVLIRCRECMRWHNLIIRSGTPELKETSTPGPLSAEVETDHV